MKSNMGTLRIITFSLVVFLVFSACSLFELTKGGTMVEETHSVDKDAAAAVKTVIVMDLGELKIQSTAAKLMEGTFQYNVPEWKPAVVYEVAGDQGTLRIDQPDKTSNLVSNGENTWDLRLGEGVPMALDIKVGAGESKLDLTRIDLTGLTIDTGAGNLNLDLRGDWTRDIDIAIRTGVGEVTIQLPANIGARVIVKNGIGSVHETGMDKDGSDYVNGAYGESPSTLNIQIDNGAGDVNLEG